MNTFQLILKQMRQRALSTWLTLLSVLLGVALAVAILILQREASSLFGQKDFGYDVIVGAKASPLQLTLNTVYQIDRSPGNIPYALYEQLLRNPLYRADVRVAVPTAVGDSYKGRRIVGTLPKMFGFDDDGKPLADDRRFEYRVGKRYEFAEGNVFAANKFQAVIGSDIPRLAGLKIGDEFQATHGLPGPNDTPDIHKPKWKVVGVLKPTHTAADGVVYIPLTSFYCIAEHDVGLVAQEAIREGKNAGAAVEQFKKKDAPPAPEPSSEPASAPGAKPQSGSQPEEEEEEHFTVRPDGTIDLQLPKEVWGLSAILVKARGTGGFNASSLIYNINNGRDAAAVNPASVMRDFFKQFLSGSSMLLLVIACLVTVVAAVGILVSIYNSVSARTREIAILRALGATRGKVLLLICAEAGLIGMLGGISGLICGHLLAAGGSIYLQHLLGEGINWLTTDRWELLYLAAVVVVALFAGLVPALKAYRVPVATNLAAA